MFFYLVAPSHTPEERQITPEQWRTFRRVIDTSNSLAGLQTTVWKKQTDVLKQAYVAASIIAIYGDRAVFIDGRIDVRLTALAAESGNIKRFFNRRFHDKGVEWQRLVYFQTVSTRRWGEKRKRGIANLHFHALMVLPERQALKQIRGTLETVFGKAEGMGGKIQFKISKPDWKESYSFNGVTAEGPIGKILYVQQGMAGTFNDLNLNEGKRSRKAPIERVRCNRQAKGLARGIPSNFNFKATLCDHVSMDAGRRAFLAWLKEEREIERQRKRNLSVPIQEEALLGQVHHRRLVEN